MNSTFTQQESTHPLALIAMVSQNGVIGKDGELPWHFPEDLKHFKKVTMGHAIIMGRKTFDSIGKPLPHRINIILSHNDTLQIPGCFVTNELPKAIQYAKEQGDDLPMVIGGAKIYEIALPLVTHLFLTTLKQDVDGDTFFPSWNKKDFELVEEKNGENPNLVFSQWNRKVASSLNVEA